MDLVLTKWIALKGTSVLASCRAEELSSRLPSVMIRDAAGFTCYLSTEREYQISGGYGAAAIYPLGKGGVLGGLWNMLEQINAGMEIDLRKIPIRQETVEICEFFDLNPYYTDSTGALLVAVEDGFGLVSVLEREGIHAAVIGRTNDGNDRIRSRREDRSDHNGFHRSALDQPERGRTEGSRRA